MEEKKTVVIAVTDEPPVSSDAATDQAESSVMNGATSPVAMGATPGPLADEPAPGQAEPTPEPLAPAEEQHDDEAVLATEPAAVPQPDAQPVPVVTAAPKPTRKKLFVVALIALVVIAGTTAAVLLAQGNGQVASQTPATSTPSTTPAVTKLGLAVTLVDGTASVVTASGQTQALTTASQLAEGDSVSTGADSRAVLTFDDGSALRLDQQTKVTLTSLKADDIRVAQAAGTAYSRLVKSDRSYTVTADDTTYTALGTAFATTVGQDKGVQVYESSVKVAGLAETIAEGKQYYKAHRDAAYAGKVTPIDLSSLEKDAFATWNLTEDEKNALFKDKLGVFVQLREHVAAAKQKAEEAKKKAAQQSKPAAGLGLAARAITGGAELSWTVTGVSAPHGFKLVRSSSSATPTFGKDEALYIEDAAARKASWKSHKDGTYWYRVCVYQKEAGCSNYSNAVQVKVTGSKPKDDKPPTPAAKVERGTLTLHSVNATGKANWTFTGKAPYGYKLVVSSKSNPKHPGSDATYISDSSATSGYIPSVKKPGTYYVRICAYTNGTESDACVNYSNQVVYTKL